jgi:hypothetical protein
MKRGIGIIGGRLTSRSSIRRRELSSFEFERTAGAFAVLQEFREVGKRAESKRKYLIAPRTRVKSELALDTCLNFHVNTVYRLGVALRVSLSRRRNCLLRLNFAGIMPEL